MIDIQQANRRSTRRCKKCSSFFIINKGDALTSLCPKCREAKQYTPPTSQEIFEDWKHHVGSEDIDGHVITKERLMRWAEDPKRELICIFCGSQPVNRDGFIYCQRCREYKGIMPNCPL